MLTSHSDKNKMTSQSLATIFGPLFTCHYESDNIHKSIEVFRFLLDIWPSKNNLKSQTGKFLKVFQKLGFLKRLPFSFRSSKGTKRRTLMNLFVQYQCKRRRSKKRTVIIMHHHQMN